MKIMLCASISEERFKSIPDIGLGYLAAIARDSGHNVQIVDCLAERHTYGDFEELVRREQPELVGIKTYSADQSPVAEMLRRVKSVSPQIHTVMGGPHPSVEKPERLYQYFPHMDFAFAGEAESGFVRFLQMLEQKDNDFSLIPGLIWRDAQGDIRVNERQVTEDLNSLPMPAWDLLQPLRYKYGYAFINGTFPAAPMAFTRGCPYLCTFCGANRITGRKVRRRTPDNVIREIKHLKETYGIRSIDVVDENLALDRNHLITLCERIIEEKLDIVWSCPGGVRIDRVDEEMIRLMEKAGCFAVSLGIESGSNRILKRIKKNLTVEQTIEKVNMIKRVSNMSVMGLFMMGFPTETKEEIEQTIDLACKLPLDVAVFNALRVMPGTEIHQELVEDGAIHEEVDYAGMGYNYFVRSYCTVSDKQMWWLYRKAHLKFYSRPTVLFGLFKRICSLTQLRILLNGARLLVMRPTIKTDPRKRKPGVSATEIEI